MSETVNLKKGLDIKLLGVAEQTLSTPDISKYAVKPNDFKVGFAKLYVNEGDEVKAGTPVFYDKYRDHIPHTSPVSGKVVEIIRGPKRVLEEIRIEADNKDEYVDFGKADPNDLSRDEITEKLLKSGIWPALRQRPYSVIAEPGDKPKAIHISAFDTNPLGPDLDFIVHGKGKLFQAGLDVLAKLTDGKVHLNVHATNTTSKVFLNSKKVQINSFSGSHPTGNVGIQVHHVDPINKGDIVWYIHPQDVLTIGHLFTEGKYDATKIVALTGSEVKKPHYYKIKQWASIEPLLTGNLINEHVRVISGNALTGNKIRPDGYLGYYDNQITVIPEGDQYEFFGWAAPGFNKFSVSRTFFSWLQPNKRYRLNTNLHGGERAFVITGLYEKVLPMDILPMQLIKAIMVEDIDLMENLGIYEVDEEDFALCEFVDPSKTPIQSIVRNGLDLMRKEMS
ncbi:MAG: Na(+)-translocating NADH-quinone reductase subunit A [Bacteroidales bacterium]|nr:Na(+)-translocating NADH-quinone reductase subunit A [Bacteroidales bacterium]